MHASTRVLLVLLALAAVVGGWWLLLANNTFIAAVIYGALWAVAVVIVTIVLFKIGFGYNRFKTKRKRGTAEGPLRPETALAELTRLRDGGLISAEEYEAKRAQIIERL